MLLKLTVTKKSSEFHLSIFHLRAIMTLALKTEYQSFYDDTPKQEIKNDFLLFFLPKSRKEVRVLPNPHFDITITQRSKGQSAVAGAAYQSGEKLFSEYDQKTKNYSGKRGILYKIGRASCRERV